jgi:hypothetical protein
MLTLSLPFYTWYQINKVQKQPAKEDEEKWNHMVMVDNQQHMIVCRQLICFMIFFYPNMFLSAFSPTHIDSKINPSN